MGETARVRDWRRDLHMIGFPANEHAWQVAEVLFPKVKVIISTICDFPHVYWFTEGRALVVIPSVWDDALQTRFLIHTLSCAGNGEEPAVENPAPPQRLHKWDEQRPSEPVLYWLMPDDALDLSMDPEEIADESGCSLEEVYQRLALVVR